MIDDEALPLLVHVDQAFSQRLPTQRAVDAIAKAEPGVPLGEIMTTQMPRLTAFRALLRDFPDRDVASLWLHAYDVEVQIHEPDPTNGGAPMPSPSSAGTGA